MSPRCVLGCITKFEASKSRGDSALYSALVKPYLEHSLPSGVPSAQTIKMIRGMKHLPYEERVGKMELFSLEKARLEGGNIVAFQYFKGTNFFMRVCGNGQGTIVLN